MQNINSVEMVIQGDDVVINQDRLLGTTRIMVRTTGSICIQHEGEYEDACAENVFMIKGIEKDGK